MALDRDEDLFEGSVNGQVKYPGTRADVVFGSNSELHALAEVYASDDAENTFVADFVAAFAKARDADRHDV